MSNIDIPRAHPWSLYFPKCNTKPDTVFTAISSITGNNHCGPNIKTGSLAGVSEFPEY